MHRRRFLTGSGTAQQVIRKNKSVWKSFFAAQDEWHNGERDERPSPPGYWGNEDELTPLPTRSLSEGPEMESFLPPAEDGWTLVDTRGDSVSTLGGRDGIRGVYEAPNGVTHHVIVFHAREGDLQISVSQFKCAGWPVIAIRDFYIMVAGSGTDKLPPGGWKGESRLAVAASALFDRRENIRHSRRRASRGLSVSPQLSISVRYMRLL